MSLSAQLKVIGERLSPYPTPLKPWTYVQIEAFAKSDPVNGKRIKALREAGLISYAAGCLGFVAGATVFYRRNNTFNGGAVAAILGNFPLFFELCPLCLNRLSGGIPSFIAAHQVSYQALSYTHELYKFNALDVNHAFFNWWSKNGGSA